MRSFVDRPPASASPTRALAVRPRAGAAHERAEHDADRMAARVLQGAGPRGAEAALDGTSPHAGAHGDRALTQRERTFYEPRFGHDFSRVRIHADARSAGVADALHAEAFTVGRDIHFAAGRRPPAAGPADPLLAHELAHVVQQSQQPQSAPRLQPRLTLTGSTDHLNRVAIVLNKGLGGFYHVKVDAAGDVKMDPVRSAHTSSADGPSPQVRAVSEPLWSMSTESRTTTVAVVAGGVPIVGSYDFSQIDITDIEALGTGQPGWNSTASLVHELVEQRQKQLANTASARGYGSPTTGAHGKGLAAELGVIGAQIESDSNLIPEGEHADGTMDGYRTVVFKYPDGSRWEVEVTLTRNNITSVTRRKLS